MEEVKTLYKIWKIPSCEVLKHFRKVSNIETDKISVLEVSNREIEIKSEVLFISTYKLCQKFKGFKKDIIYYVRFENLQNTELVFCSVSQKKGVKL